jgi:hypothetical protein
MLAGMTEPRFKSFEEFWPFYVREHANKTNRRLHFVGSSLAGALLAYGLVGRKLWPIAAAPVVGYGFAWVGHFFVEGNRPATFKHPLYSFVGDWKMWSKIATGSMDAEVERVLRDEAAARSTANAANNGSAVHSAE